MSLNIVPAYDTPDAVGELFTEYTNMLVELDPAFAQYLVIQNYDEEIKHLEGKYGQPWGRLYLVYCDGTLAGCIGLRKLDAERCEMKRLYVRPRFRGKRIGEQLVEKIIADAKEIGYQHMLLDTLPPLKSAIHMYRKLGFYDIPCYNDSPIDTTIFMPLDL